MEFLQNKKLVALIGGIIAVLVIGGSLFSYNESTRKAMVSHEKRLNGSYQNAQVELDTYVATIKESMGVAKTSSSEVKDLVEGMMLGRYGDPKNPENTPALMQAITEAGIDLNAVTGGYKTVQDAVISGRAKYANVQKGLRSDITLYETWRDESTIRSMFISGKAGKGLEARIGDSVVKGPDALDQMKRLIMSGETKDAYHTGEMAPLDLNPVE